MYRKLIPKPPTSYVDLNNPRESGLTSRMDEIRDRLNETKSRLDFIGIGLVKSVMKSLDRYYSLHKILKRKYNAQVVTNAWLKCYELLNEFNLLDVTSPPGHRNIFLNAELPGSFICAINHYCQTQTNLTVDWRASSLVDIGHGHAIGNEPTGDRYGIYEMNP